jgi:hypothetical protein
MNGPLAAIVVGELAFVAFIIWVVARFKLERRRQAAEERLRLLERLGGPQELLDFLNSQAGEKLMRLSNPAPNPTAALSGTLLAGVICVALGLGFLAVSYLYREEPFIVPALLGTFVGIGLLIGGAISYRLARRLGRNDR